MGKWTEEEEQILVRLRDLEVPWKDLAYVFNRQEPAVRAHWNALNDKRVLGEKTILPKKGSNYKLKRTIHRLLKQKPNRTIPDLRKSLLEEQFPVEEVGSLSTLRRRVKELQFKKVTLRRAQFISTTNQQKRLEFAREMLTEEEMYWERIIWSDETMIRKHPNNKKVQHWVLDWEDNSSVGYNPQYLQGRFGVMFWGCISKYGFGPLVVVEGSMDHKQYIQIIREHLLPELRLVKEQHGIDMVFMQDNAPCHKAKAVTQFFESNNVELLKWPAQSPDLNPIENLWAIVKRKVESEFGIPRTRDELINNVFTIWDFLDENLAVVLSESMSRRMQACIKAKGMHSGY